MMMFRQTVKAVEWFTMYTQCDTHNTKVFVKVLFFQVARKTGEGGALGICISRCGCATTALPDLHLTGQVESLIASQRTGRVKVLTAVAVDADQKLAHVRCEVVVRGRAAAGAQARLADQRHQRTFRFAQRRLVLHGEELAHQSR